MSRNSKRLRIEIKTPNDFNCVACETVDEFLETFTSEEGLIRKPTQEDVNDFGGEDLVGFMYTQKGMRLYNAFCRRLEKLGVKSFPDKAKEIEVKSYTMIFP